jgi:hypothetical protein
MDPSMFTPEMMVRSVRDDDRARRHRTNRERSQDDDEDRGRIVTQSTAPTDRPVLTD